MPRPAKPPRLYLREREGRESRWVILDGGREVGTSLGAEHKSEAEKAFSEYLAQKHRPAFADGEPSRVPVADVLTYYLEHLEVTSMAASGPQLAAYHADRLLEFFGVLTCDIDAETCGCYVSARTEGSGGRRPVKIATARRELETLAAALNFASDRGKLNRPVKIHLPEGSSPRPRWLTRPEAARLLAGALGFRCLNVDKTGRGLKWRRISAPNYHVARFILIGLYTATRHASILKLRWTRSAQAGWIDLDDGILYRRGYDEPETRKRRGAAPIPHNLLPHLQRWSRMTIEGPCEYAGGIIQRQKTGFAHARELAGLSDDVTPHTLKHTCITWLLQAGVPIWEVAGFTSTSEPLIRRVYGHHSRDHMPRARAGFRDMPRTRPAPVRSQERRSMGVSWARRTPGKAKSLKRMVDAAGIEPATPTMST